MIKSEMTVLSHDKKWDENKVFFGFWENFTLLDLTLFLTPPCKIWLSSCFLALLKHLHFGLWIFFYWINRMWWKQSVFWFLRKFYIVGSDSLLNVALSDLTFFLFFDSPETFTFWTLDIFLLNKKNMMICRSEVHCWQVPAVERGYIILYFGYQYFMERWDPRGFWQAYRDLRVLQVAKICLW